MNSIIRHPSIFVLGEVLTAACNMGKEILQYKRAISELELQREQMHQQANIMHHQIQAQLTQEIKRIDVLSDTFKTMLHHNQEFINQHNQRESYVQQQCISLIQSISQTTDPQLQQTLTTIWLELIKQLDMNRQESARLHDQIMNAHQQFSIDISQKNLSFKDVF